MHKPNASPAPGSGSSVLVFSCDRIVEHDGAYFCSPIVLSSIRLVTDNFLHAGIVAPLVPGPPDPEKHLQVPQNWRVLGIAHAPGKAQRPRQFVEVCRVAWQLRQDYDVMYTRLFSLEAFPAAVVFRLLRTQPWCITLHGDVEESIAISWAERPDLARRTVSRAFALICRWLCGSADVLLSSGPVLGEKYFPRGRAWTTFMDAGIRREDLNATRVDCCEGTVVKLVHVGDISRRKGVHILFEAMAILRRRGAAVQLEMIGAGDLEWANELIARLGIQDCVEFAGFLKYGEALFSRICMNDILVAPSLGSEGWNRAILEANAQGLPIIASNVNSLGVAVDSYGAGVVVEPGRPEAIADAVETIRDNPEARKAMIAASLQRAADNLYAVEFVRIRTFLQQHLPYDGALQALEKLDLEAAGR